MESLALDRAKAASERSEREREQRERERAEQQRNVREAKLRRMSQPPPKTTPVEEVTELAIKLPNGQRLQRRFYSTDHLENVYGFLEIEAPELDGVAFDLTTFDRKKLYDRQVQLAELPTRKTALVVHLRE